MSGRKRFGYLAVLTILAVLGACAEATGPGRKSDGASCTSGSQCSSGHCTDPGWVDYGMVGSGSCSSSYR